MVSKLPQNLEAEQVVLGLMIISKSCLAKGISELQADPFHNQVHNLIFHHIRALFKEGTEVGITTLNDHLQSKKALDAVGGPLKVVELAQHGISDTEFDTYLGILKDKATKRRVIKAADNIMKAGYADQMPEEEFLRFTSKTIWQATPHATGSLRIISSGELYDARRKSLIHRHKSSIIQFGWEAVDSLIVSGLVPGDVSIIAARPSIGKSALKTNVIHNLLNAKFGVTSFAPEQGFATEQDRLEAVMTQIPLLEIINSRLWKKRDYRVKKIKEANQKIDEEYNYHIIPSRGVDVSDVRTALYQITQKDPVHVVFFDLFDKLIDVNVAANKAQTVGVKLGEMSRIAEEFGVHICLLVQINRQIEKRADKRPKISDIKDSGAYEEVARLILLLYREKYYFPTSLNDDMEIIIAKQSNGPLGKVAMHFDEETLTVTPSEEYLGIM